MNNRLLDLTQGDVVELPDARGTTLRIGRGALWVTQERDARDVLLTAGDAWTVERDGLTVAQARADTSVVLVGGSVHEARVSRRGSRWLERIGAWLHDTAERSLQRSHVPHV